MLPPRAARRRLSAARRPPPTGPPRLALAGRELIAQLAASPRWGRVVAVVRRASASSDFPAGAEALVVDFDALAADAGLRAALAAAPARTGVFCALGTTRGAAGSAEAFRKVDYGYVAAAAGAAAAAKTPWFGLVSAVGANARLWGPSWKLGHGLLYSKTKGEAEAAVCAAGFARAAIARPGLIERGAAVRTTEKIFSLLMPSVPAARVAAALVADAEAALGGQGAPAGERVIEMAELRAGVGA